MPLYERYVKQGILVEEFEPINSEILHAAKGSRRLISPGIEKDITPMSMKLEESFSFWGCTYTVITHNDEMGTGTLRMRANSSFGWGLVYRPEDNKIVPVIGSHVFPMGPEARAVFIFARRTQTGAELLKFLEWHPPKKEVEQPLIVLRYSP